MRNSNLIFSLLILLLGFSFTSGLGQTLEPIEQEPVLTPTPIDGGGSSVSVSISGDSSVRVNDTRTYNVTVNGAGFLFQGNWTVYGGTITSQNNHSVSVRWTSGGNGLVRYNLTSPESTSASYYVSVTAPPPSTPLSPTVQSSNCGVTVLQRSQILPTGVTWYWQISSNGTSTSNSGLTISRTSGTRYYLRARNNSTLEWSASSSSVNYTVKSKPSRPSTPTIQSNSCESLVLQRGAPPSGVTWYWQSSANGTSTSNSSSTVTRTSSGTYYLRARNNTSLCWSDSSSSVSYLIRSAPSTPSAPTVQSNSCGETILQKGASPRGVTWYWQSSANGTSTANSGSTIKRTSGSRYYLRARNNTTLCWSPSSSSIRYLIKSEPSTPSVPSVQSSSCGETILQKGPSPSGVTWYWQSSANGISTTNSGSTIRRTNGTRYYLRARNNTTLCWSPSSSSVSYTVNTAPNTPGAPIIKSNNCGSTVLQRGLSLQGVTLYWQSSPNGTSTANSNVTVTRTSGTRYYLRARNNTTLCWSPSSSSVNYSIKSKPSTPSAPTVQSSSCGETILQKSASPTGVTWYWQSSASGTSTSNSSSTVSRTSSGTYYLRARNNTSLCWSPSSSSIRYLIKSEPSIPSAPSVQSSSCGETILQKGPSPFGVTWYWQSSANGTSTANSGSTIRRTSGTRYYLRARNNTTLCWSASSSSVNYSIKSKPSTPSSPSVQSSSCGETILQKGASPTGVTWYWQSNASGTSTSNSSSTLTRTSGSTYYLRARNNTTLCWSPSSSSVSYTVKSEPSTPSAPTVQSNNCGETILQKGASPTGITWYWQSSANGTSTLNSSSTISRTSGTIYYLRARNNSTQCWSSSSSSRTYTVDTPSITSYLDSDGDGYGDPNQSEVSCDMPTGYVSNGNDLDDSTSNITNIQPKNYYRDADGDGDGNPSISLYYSSRPNGYVENADDPDDTTAYITSQPLQYFYEDADGDGLGDPAVSVHYSVMPSGYANNANDQCPEVFGTSNGCPETILSNENYIYTKSYVKPSTAPSTNASDYIENITYFDGLGRPMQNIAIRGATDGKDIITHIGYDDYGRKDKEWLAYHEPTGDLGSYRQGVPQATQAYYQSKHALDFAATTPTADINAYSEINYEASPLNRVLEQGAPGDDWAVNKDVDTDHTIKFDYQTNTSGDAVKQFEVVFASTSSTVEHSLKYVGNYAASQLYKSITKDENWQPGQSNPNNHTTQEFKNKLGQVVLKRTFNGGQAHDTYYIYDDYGNLSYVLSPEASNSVDLPTTVGATVPQSLIKNLGYYYGYDQRNNLVKKQIPGKGEEYIIYDKLNRPILTQDANLRADNNKKWLFTKYDVFDRVVYTGIYIPSTAINRANFQADAYSSTYSYDLNETRNATGFTSGGATINYTKAAFPTSQMEVLTVNYYDDYNFDKKGLTADSSPLYSNEPFTDRTKTLATGSLVKVLDTNSWIISITKYDKKARPVYMHTKNDYLQSHDITHLSLDFVGKTLETRNTHIKTNAETIVTVDKFTYDNAQRLLKQSQIINDQPAELIVFNEYDELGQLVEKKVGGSDADQNDYTQVSALQRIDYDYNIRGWLKGINDPATNDPSKLFAFGINYNNPTQAGNELYNGNISETHWRTQSESKTKRMYSYEYDALNRITDANSWNTNYNLSNVGYDKNGNISQLTRSGLITSNNHGTIDNLTYTYKTGTNQLENVIDSSNQLEGFNQTYTGTTAYIYDENGNMTKDENKNITKIDYNHLNLPKRIDFASQSSTGRYIEYAYDATGIKQKKVVQEENINSSVTEYAGGFIYKKPESASVLTLEFFSSPEGYIEPDNQGGYDYVYQYKDHLGNIRLSYKDNNGTLEIVEEKNYYPFGLKHKGYNNVVVGNENPYKYNGKELNEELGLNWYDYGARNYDASLGRYFNIDRLSEAYYDLNPYQYTANNPVKFIDVNGDYIYVGVNGYRYNNGELQEEKDGEWVTYNPEEGSYEANILASLNKITDGDPNSFGSQFLGLFENDDVNVSLFENTSQGDYKGKNVTDGTNIYTYFNQSGSVRTTGRSEKLSENFHITLGHELAHGLANNLFSEGALSDTWIPADPNIGLKKPIKSSEIFASMYENMLRSEQGLELRTHYIGGTSDDRSRLVQKSKTKSPFGKVYNPTQATLEIFNNIIRRPKVKSVNVIKPAGRQ